MTERHKAYLLHRRLALGTGVFFRGGSEFPWLERVFKPQNLYFELSKKVLAMIGSLVSAPETTAFE